MCGLRAGSPDRPRRLGRRAYPERSLRSALHVRYLWNGALLHAHGDGAVLVGGTERGQDAVAVVQALGAEAELLQVVQTGRA